MLLRRHAGILGASVLTWVFVFYFPSNSAELPQWRLILNAAISLLLGGVVALFSIGRVTKIFRALSYSSSTRLFAFYVILCVVSVLWSEDLVRSIYYALLSTVMLVGLVLLTPGDDCRSESHYLADILFNLVLMQVVLALLSYVAGISTASGINDALHGVGSFEALISLLLYAHSVGVKNKSALPSLLVLLAVIAVTSSSKTFLSLGFAIILASVLAGRLTLSKLRLILIWAVILIVVLAVLYTVFFEWQGDLGKFEHLHGRSTIWQFLILKYLGADTFYKVLGFGFAAGEKFEYQSQIFYNSHNALLSALVGTGVVGFLLLFSVFAKATLLSFRYRASSPILLAIIVSCLVNTLANQSIGGTMSGPWIATIIALRCIDIERFRNKIGATS